MNRDDLIHYRMPANSSGRRWKGGRFALSRGLFLRLLGLVYFTAFVSLAPQLRGLV